MYKYMYIYIIHIPATENYGKYIYIYRYIHAYIDKKGKQKIRAQSMALKENLYLIGSLCVFMYVESI